MNHETLQTELDGAVATVTLNRPDKANALSAAMWQELRAAMRWADETDAVRVVILRGAGRHFTAGIDLAMLAGIERRSRTTARRAVGKSCAGSSSISRIA